MSKFLSACVLASLMAGPAMAEKFGLGRPALPEEIAAWDLDVSPDGTGLPPGSGDVLTGEELFSDNCAACHGEFAEGVDNWPALAGGGGTLADKDPVKTVGSYWPHLSTTWDYVNRSMPFGDAQSLSPDQVYAIVAYILYSNDLVDEEFVLSDENLADLALPNADGFVIDDREDAEYINWRAEPCMTDCKDAVEVTMRARVLDVTPDTGGNDADATQDTASADTAQTAQETAAEPDPELIAAGEKAFKKCKACHQVGDGAKNRTGPHLNAVIGRTAASVDGFKYSKAMRAAGEDGLIWTEDEIAAFLTKPKTYLKGTKMSFAGFRKESDIAALIAYLAAEGN